MRSQNVLAIGLGLSVLILSGGGAARTGRTTAPRWSLELVLTVSGQYRIVENAGPTSGDYSFVVHWKGSLERDDVDWRLTHHTCEVSDWTVVERPAASSSSPGQVLTANDFEGRPVFEFRYVLQDQGRIELAFGMEGFAIPLNPSLQKFPLILPASARARQPSPEFQYDDFIRRGSNRIQFDERELGKTPLERTFSWTWGRYQSALEQKLTVHCHQSHQARLTVSFTPQRP